MTREEARERILEVIAGVAHKGAGFELRNDTAHLLKALLDIEWQAQRANVTPEVKAAAQDILMVLGIQAEA